MGKSFALGICFGVAIMIAWPAACDWWSSRGLVSFRELPKESQDFLVYGMSQEEFEEGICVTLSMDDQDDR